MNDDDLKCPSCGADGYDNVKLDTDPDHQHGVCGSCGFCVSIDCEVHYTDADRREARIRDWVDDGFNALLFPDVVWLLGELDHARRQRDAAVDALPLADALLTALRNLEGHTKVEHRRGGHGDVTLPLRRWQRVLTAMTEFGVARSESL